MNIYKTRKIAFRELHAVDQWQVKTYTITKYEQFGAEASYQAALAMLSEWLQMENSFDARHEHLAFLIIHEGTEGVFAILNWWVGENMLNTHIFMAHKSTPTVFEKISGDGLAPCIWELEVINHERLSWIRNILKSPNKPAIQNYLNDQYNGEI